MSGAAVVAPLLDVFAPAHFSLARRRVRNAAIWLALAAWLLPAFHGIGTDSTERRAAMCAAFAVVVAATWIDARLSDGWTATSAAAAFAAGATYFVGRGALFGVGFFVFAEVVFGLTALRLRYGPPPVRSATDDDAPAVSAAPPKRATRVAAWIGLAAAAYVVGRTATEPQVSGTAYAVALFIVLAGPAIVFAQTTWTPPAVMRWLANTGVAILLTLHFAWQATVVPTGSMQPTIMGAAGRGGVAGDHLVVERFSYLFHDPRRWDVVVFEYPLYRERLFVKRVVGLPGEHVEIRDGDLWVNGAVAKKPPLVQATMWRGLFPRSSPGARPKTMVEGFTHDPGTGGSWKRISDVEVRCTPEKDAPSTAFCNGTANFADVRVALTAVSDGFSVAVARVTSRGAVVSLSLDWNDSAPQAQLSVDRNAVKLVELPLRPGVAVRAELCVADGEAWAVIDGREVARVELPADRRGKNRVEIGATGNPVTFRDVRVDRDVVYSAPGATSVWDVPADGFFFIGDNVEESEDSRRWTADVFTPASGAPIAAADHYPDENGRPVFGRIRTEKGRFVFTDVDGVPRDLPVEGTKRERNVPFPFARRNHLVGRAFMIFWPLTTPDAGVRPRLIP